MALSEDLKAQITADFKARFPEFRGEDIDSGLPILLNFWQCYYPCEYNGCDKEIVLNLLAHLFVTSPNAPINVSEIGKNTGTLKSESVTSTGISETYADSSVKGNQSHDFFNSTVYGQRFLMLTMGNVRAYFV
jgi:hypothetical protein